MYQEHYTINIRDINYGQHMDHLALLNYLHETRVRFLQSHGYSEINIDGKGSSLVVVELNCKYRKECFYGDKITVNMHLEKVSETRLGFRYAISKEKGKVIVANAQIIVAFINQSRQVVPVPLNLLNFT